MIQTILFWDIDGTLLTTARAGISAWENSFAAVAGRTLSLEKYPTAGLTDVEIAEQLAKKITSPTKDDAQKILMGYEERLPGCLPLRQGFVLPGVLELLQQLQHIPEVYSMLLTGNTKKGAAAKLAYYGLDHFFEAGAFSDGMPDRPAIAKKAVQLVKQRFGEEGPLDFFVIGDTPHDIHCGKAVGAKTIAVCTGGYDFNALSLHQPWLILDSLVDSKKFFAKLNLVRVNA